MMLVRSCCFIHHKPVYPSSLSSLPLVRGFSFSEPLMIKNCFISSPISYNKYKESKYSYDKCGKMQDPIPEFILGKFTCIFFAVIDQINIQVTATWSRLDLRIIFCSYTWGCVIYHDCDYQVLYRAIYKLCDFQPFK